MKRNQEKAMYAKQAQPFKVGAYVRSDNDKFGQITKMLRKPNPDGTKFFEVAYSYGKEQNRSDHQLEVVKKWQVRPNALQAIQEVKRGSH